MKSTHTKIYFDHAASSPVDPSVLTTMLPYFSGAFGNPSSMHTSGRKAHAVLRNAREHVADILHARADEIIFTGSGTESDNLALLGTARANKTHGKRIIISAIEHKAVLESARILRSEGFEVVILPVDSTGLIHIDECMRLVTADTILVSVMYANNEIGTIEPIRELAREIHAYRKKAQTEFPYFHTDACQAAQYLPIEVDELGVDLMSLNGSKIGGPKGVGILYRKNTVGMAPILVGGEQENGLRAGTENIAAIAGMSYALTKAVAKRSAESARLSRLRNYCTMNLLKLIPSAMLNGHPIERLPNNIHVSIPAVEGESMVLLLDNAGIEAATGSACSTHDLQPSHVLLAIGQNPEIIHGSIRLTFGRETKKKDIDYFLKVFPPIVQKLRNMSAIRE